MASEGIESLGGDDFDEYPRRTRPRLGRHFGGGARRADPGRDFPPARRVPREKGSASPEYALVHVDLDKVRPDWSSTTVTTADFYRNCRPAVQETMHAVENLIESQGLGTRSSGSEANIDTLYVTGGASELPLVSRMLREVFGRRVRRSAYTRSATAIGLAIQADAQAGYQLRDKFTRYFGVWREAEDGRYVIFDPLFLKGTSLPAPNEPLAARYGATRPSTTSATSAIWNAANLPTTAAPPAISSSGTTFASPLIRRFGTPPRSATRRWRAPLPGPRRSKRVTPAIPTERWWCASPICRKSTTANIAWAAGTSSTAVSSPAAPPSASARNALRWN